MIRTDEKTFPPEADENSKILILGSFPSPLSFASGFYYGHPQNRFWPMLAEILGAAAPQTVEEKKSLLKNAHIALWDVLETCEIDGAADSSIRNPVVNPIAKLIAQTRVSMVLINGGKAFQLFEKYCLPCAVPYYKMPSTSPANAAWRFERLKEAWQPKISEGLKR